jgi:DNA-binding NtrC family response regulator
MLDVLVADDDRNVLESVSRALIEAGHRVTEAADGGQAAELLSLHAFDLAICDVQMPKLGGLTLLRRIRREAPGTAVVIMTAYAKIPDVVESLRDGAVDYVTKPFDPDEFTARVVGPIAERRALKKKFENAQTKYVARDAGATLVAVSPVMRRLVGQIAVLSASDAPVVITGDRGTGKELVARTIHAQGPRRAGPFVLLDGVLLAGELEEGAVPEVAREEWLLGALGGTLVLDGIDGLPVAAQARLAAIVSAPQARARRAEGGRALGTRLITLTREGVADRANGGTLLDALYYRLSGVHLHVPSLSERASDLCSLASQLLEELTPPDKTIPGLLPEVWQALSCHGYPGNVRELRWILEHALAMAEGGPIELRHLPEETFELLRPSGDSGRHG